MADLDDGFEEIKDLDEGFEEVTLDEGFDSVPMGGELGMSDIVAQEYEAQPEAQPLPKISQPKAALKGAQQGVTMGFADEIGAGTQSGLDRMQRLLNEYTGLVGKSPTQVSEELAEQGFTGDLGPTSPDELYDEAAAEERRQLAAAEEQHPGTTMAADVAGSLLLPIPGATAVKAGKTLPKAIKTMDKMSKVKKGAAAGATMGAIEGAGRTEEDLASVEGLKDVAAGGALGVVGGAIGGKLSQKMDAATAQKAIKKAKEDANTMALESVGASKKHFSKEYGEKLSKRSGVEKAKGTGTTLQKEGLIKLRQDPVEFNSAVNNKLDEVFDTRIQPVTQEIDDLVNQSRQANPEIFADDLTSLRTNLGDNVQKLREINKYNPSRPGFLGGKAPKDVPDMPVGITDKKGVTDQLYNAESINKKLDAITTDMEKLMQKENSLSEILALKRKVSKVLSDSDWSKSDVAGAKDYLKGVISEIDRFSKSVSNKVDPDLAKQLADHNKTYSNLLLAKEISIEQLTKDAAASGFSLGDYIAMGIGGGIGGMPGAAIAMGGKKAIEKGTGKSIPQLIKTQQALSKFKKVKKLQDITEKRMKPKTKLEKTIGIPSRQDISDAPSVTGASLAAAGAAGKAAVTKDSEMEPYKLHQRTAKMAERATPEMLQQQAQSIREEHGEKGERLAATLEKMSGRDVAGRRALMFHLLQNPQYKKMLMPVDVETEE